MKIPKTLKVAGMVYQVIKKYKFKEGSFYGQHSPTQAEIRLNSVDGQSQPLNSQHLDETFFHELLHAVNYHYNSREMDEGTIDRMSCGLYQVLKDNKLLRE